MQYGRPAGLASGVVAANTALAATGFRSLLWAEVGVALLLVGVILVRVAAMRKKS